MTTPTAAPDIEAMIAEIEQAAIEARYLEGKRIRPAYMDPRLHNAREALRTALAAGAKAVEEVDHLSDQLHEARQQPWPKWAERILQILQGYGYEAEEDGVDLPECLADWFEGFDSEQTLAKSAARALASEARVRELEAELVVATERKRNNDADMLAEIRTLKADIERKDAALRTAHRALSHPRDGWFDNVCNEALPVVSAALAKKEPAHE